MILREMADSLKRISDRQEDIYAAITPLIKLVGGINQRQAFDKTVLNGLMNLAKFDLDCLEDESKVRFVEGNIHLLKKQNKINSDIRDYDSALDTIQGLSKQGIDERVGRIVENSSASLLNLVRQECIAAISKTNASMKNMLDEKNKEITSAINRAKTEVDWARDSVQTAVDDTKELVVSMVDKELASLKKHREDDINRAIVKLNKSAENLDIKLKQIDLLAEQVEKRLSGYEFMREVFDTKLADILDEAEEKMTECHKRMQTAISQNIAGQESKFENYLKEIQGTSTKLDVKFSEDVRSELTEISNKFSEKMRELDEAKKEVDAIASSMSTTIMSAERTVAQVGNFIPKRERKVFINGKRNN